MSALLSQVWNCENAFEYKCPRKWVALAPTDSKSIRYCNECQQNVYMCESPEEFVRNGKQGRCLAVPTQVVPGALPRWPARLSQAMFQEQERQTRTVVSFWEAVIAEEPAFSPEGMDEIRPVIQKLRSGKAVRDVFKRDEGRD